MREGNAGGGGMESQNRKDRVEDWIQDVLRYRIEDKDKKRVWRAVRILRRTDRRKMTAGF